LTPTICIVVQGAQTPSFENQTLRSFKVLRDVSEEQALEQSEADYFLWLTGGRELRPQAFEECVWGLQANEWVTWADTGAAPPPSIRQAAGPLGVSRSTLATNEARRTGAVCGLPWRCRVGAAPVVDRAIAGSYIEVPPVSEGTVEPEEDPPLADDSGIRQNFRNAGLFSLRAWLRHPLRSAARLLPLRLKERINRWAGRAVFDLTFYLQFQPSSVLIDGGMIEHLDYAVPLSDGRRRIAFCTPHLGFGGAENVLLEIARQFDRSRFELFLIATQSTDDRLLPEWLEVVDHVYDLRRMLPVEQTLGALYSMAVNWQWDGLVVQNTPLAYSPLPAIKEKVPDLRVIDVLHNIDEDWDFFSATLDVTEWIDRRIVISDAGRQRLIDMAVDEGKIRLIRNGVDLEQFTPPEREREAGPLGILFAGHLIDRKRPLLLLDIDRELQRDPPEQAYEFVIAGDGPLLSTLRSRIQSQGRGDRFTLLGRVDEVARVLANASLLVVPSTEEGLPLVIVEALAMEVPVISSRVGAVDEAVPPDCGMLVDNDGLEAEMFAAAIRELLADNERRAEMGRAGRLLVEQNYDLRRAQADYRRLIDELFPV
jgi:glycosyltransferase involved in cell wall biosynthesis